MSRPWATPVPGLSVVKATAELRVGPQMHTDICDICTIYQHSQHGGLNG